MKINVRDAVPADAAVIAEFNNRIAVETEHKSLDFDLLRPGVEKILDDAAKGRYWVAEVDGDVVGQIMVTYEWSDWRNGMIWWLQSVYVVDACRRKGVFSSLYRHVESQAKALPDVCGIRLYVEKDNKRAQQTYATMGMIDANYRVMEAMFDPSP